MGMKPQVVVGLIVAAAIIITIIVLVATSLKKLASDQIGIAYDTINKDLSTETKIEGLHNGPPGFEFIIFPSVFKTLSFDMQCLNKDGVKIDLDVTYQYKAKPKFLREIILEFKDFEGYKKVLAQVGESALHEACSHFDTAQFQSERGKFQDDVRVKVIEKYENLHANITDLQVNNIARPSAYENAIRSKERAREDIEVARNERPRLLTEAQTVKKEASTTADIIKDKAESEARILQEKANAEAEAIKEQYQREADAYKEILSDDGLNFSVEGFISYMGTRVISSAKNPVYIGLQSPAKSSYSTP